jgi:hypothetical protein
MCHILFFTFFKYKQGEWASINLYAKLYSFSFMAKLSIYKVINKQVLLQML